MPRVGSIDCGFSCRMEIGESRERPYPRRSAAHEEGREHKQQDGHRERAKNEGTPKGKLKRQPEGMVHRTEVAEYGTTVPCRKDGHQRDKWIDLRNGWKR